MHMLFLQQGPANTVNYMIAGYVVIFGVILIYLLSLYVRQRNLQRDLEVLEELDEKSK
jgi:CcmD family protein